jgi:protein CpxP
MRHFNGKWFAAAAGAVTAFMVLTGFGHAHRGWGGAMDEEKAKKFATWKVNDVLDDLEATPDQRAKVQALKDDRITEAFQLAAGHKEIRTQLLAQWNAANPDRKQIHALVDQDIDRLRALAHQVADSLVDVHDVLTPEQRQKVSEKLAEHAGN